MMVCNWTPFNNCDDADIAPVEGGDCQVDAGDLAQLNAQWTSVGSPECAEMGCPPYCTADFDESCSVGPSDLAYLLARWGPCDDLELAGECGGEGFMEGEEGSSYSLFEVLSLLGFSDIESCIEGYAAASPTQIAAWQLILDAIDGS
jgi:hypothetical protein